MATIPKSKPAQTKVVARAPASKINPLQTPISSPDILPPMMPALRTPARPMVVPRPVANNVRIPAQPQVRSVPTARINPMIGMEQAQMPTAPVQAPIDQMPAQGMPRNPAQGVRIPTQPGVRPTPAGRTNPMVGQEQFNPIDQPIYTPGMGQMDLPYMPGQQGPGNIFDAGNFPNSAFANEPGRDAYGRLIPGYGAPPEGAFIGKPVEYPGNPSIFGGQQDQGQNPFLPMPINMGTGEGSAYNPTMFGGQQNSFNPNPNPGQQAPLNLSSTMDGQQAMQQAPQNMAQMGASTGGKSAGRGGMNTSYGGGKSR